MIIALLVIMFIILVVLYNVIDKIKEIIEALEYVADCNFRDDLRLDEAIATNKYTNERINDTNERVNKIEETVKGIQVLIGTPKVCNANGLTKADKIKTGTIPKSCNIDGKCN